MKKKQKIDTMSLVLEQVFKKSDELMTLFVSTLSWTDIMRLRQVSRQFRDFVLNNNKLWWAIFTEYCRKVVTEYEEMVEQPTRLFIRRAGYDIANVVDILGYVDNINYYALCMQQSVLLVRYNYQNFIPQWDNPFGQKLGTRNLISFTYQTLWDTGLTLERLIELIQPVQVVESISGADVSDELYAFVLEEDSENYEDGYYFPYPDDGRMHVEMFVRRIVHELRIDVDMYPVEFTPSWTSFNYEDVKQNFNVNLQWNVVLSTMVDQGFYYQITVGHSSTHSVVAVSVPVNSDLTATIRALIEQSSKTLDLEIETVPIYYTAHIHLKKD